MAILTELKDPRVRGVTVTYVEMAPDMRQAKVHVSVMGDEKQQQLTLHGLRSAAGFLQSKVAAGIDTRYTPRLEFQLDQGVKNSIAVAAILQRVLPPAAPAAVDDVNADVGDDTDGGEEFANDDAANGPDGASADEPERDQTESDADAR